MVTAPRTLAWLALAGAGLAACVSNPTVVLCVVSSDFAPAEPLGLTVRVRRAGSGDGGPPDLAWSSVDGGRPDAVSFGIQPAHGQSPDGAFVVTVEGVSGATRVRRVASTYFVPHVTTQLRIFLAAACAAGVDEAECADARLAAGCSRQDVCEAHGETCGDDAQCVPIAVTTGPVATDASDRGVDRAARDAARMDAARDVAPPPCGAVGQACCAGGACASGGVCAQSGVCAACGARDEACYAGEVCASGTRCAGGRCACGATDQPCCDGTTCAMFHQCENGRCVCGSRGHSCCGGTACSDGSTCLNTTMYGPVCLCGSRDQPCCPGRACTDGSFCLDTGFGPLCLCGTRDRPCCPGRSCTDGSSCLDTGFGALCLCGTDGRPCCSSGPACTDGTVCRATGFGPICQP